MRLHMARLGQRFGGRDSATQFESWIGTELGDPDGFRRLLADFPMLARTFATITTATVAAWSELVDRLAADWPKLVRLFGADRLVASRQAWATPTTADVR